MHQILQNLGSGETMLAEVPAPGVRAGHLLIETRASLVSIGTEKMLIDFGKSGWIDKARKQPDKVRQVIEKIKTDGLFPTLEAVKAKLDQPIPLGYCNVGVVAESGQIKADADAAPAAAGKPEISTGTSQFPPGTRVVSNGPHAEVVCIPVNLCAKIPDAVSDEAAAFTVVGAIGLQGIRLLQPTLGESFVVTGLGLIGLLCVQMLRAHGCRVLGVDFDSSKCELARQFGAETVDLSKGGDPISAAMAFSQGRGMDGVLITASSRSNEPVHQAALMCRKRGRIVLVGVVGLELSRADFYEKELSFQVSCSYGPGRYDEQYEQKGRDYPLPYVRWTEQRNFEAVLDLLASGHLNVQPLISHRFAFSDALRGYETVGQGKALGVVLQYGSGQKAAVTGAPVLSRMVKLKTAPSTAPSAAEPVVGMIGAGGFTGQVLLPALAKTGARLKSIASAAGVTGAHLGKKFGFEQVTTDAASIIADPEVNTVMITTRHNTHARFVLQALKAGKRVYVEKPLCLNTAELEEITAAYQSAPGAPFLMVGFNRRFAPQVAKMKALVASASEPKTMIMTVNAGAIPANHWTQSRDEGGGRIIGEGCHFIDLLRFLAGAPIVGAHSTRVGAGPIPDDKMTMTLSFADGSTGTIHYFANGHKSFPKERLELFCSGRILQLDNFRKLQGFGWPCFGKMNLWGQDKGHAAEMAALIDAVRQGKPSPMTFEEIVEVTRASFTLA